MAVHVRSLAVKTVRRRLRFSASREEKRGFLLAGSIGHTRGKCRAMRGTVKGGWATESADKSSTRPFECPGPFACRRDSARAVLSRPGLSRDIQPAERMPESLRRVALRIPGIRGLSQPWILSRRAVLSAAHPSVVLPGSSRAGWNTQAVASRIPSAICRRSTRTPIFRFFTV